MLSMCFRLVTCHFTADFLDPGSSRGTVGGNSILFHRPELTIFLISPLLVLQVYLPRKLSHLID